MENKKCGTCGIEKPLNNFYKYKTGLRSYCKECNLNNSKKFRANPNNKNKVLEYSRKQYKKPETKAKKYISYSLRLIKIKKQAVEYKGGKCSVCGYNKCLSALEFHHKNPLEKDIKLNSRGIDRRKAFEKLKAELDKCILLCANCHREIHEKLRNG